jgi:hypothetical protein
MYSKRRNGYNTTVDSIEVCSTTIRIYDAVQPFEQGSRENHPKPRIHDRQSDKEMFKGDLD